MRRARTALVLTFASAVMAVLWLLPPRAAPTGVPPDYVVRGAYHVHTNRSDGSGSPEAVAAAAARAGLRFVILTDHGDGTRAPAAAVYLGGVLVLDAVEVNTAAGHLAVLGLGQSPYPLAGAADAVLEDVHRLGGVGIAAHPGSPRASLRWSDWEAPVDGLEWINGDSEWRDEPRLRITRALLTYLIRGPEAMGTLLDEPSDVLSQWNRLSATRPVFALAAVDAHARLGVTDDDPDRSSMHVPIPSYEASFRTLTNHVVLDAPLTGDAAADALRLLAAIRRGRSYSVADALATPGALVFTATSQGDTRTIGDVVAPTEEVVLRASVSAPQGTTLVLLKDGNRVHQAVDGPLAFTAGPAPASYRVEAFVPSGPGMPPVPWILSNPIYVGHRVAAPQRDEPAWMTSDPARVSEATTEAGDGDRSELARQAGVTQGGAIAWRFVLKGGVPMGQFAALQIPVNGVREFSAVGFRVSASRPIRAWVQLRVPNNQEDRWGSTFYADTAERMVVIPFSKLRRIGDAADAIPLERVRSLLFAIDTLNSLPGSAGETNLSEISWLK